MKREIACKECAARWRKLVGRYPGEEVKVVTGKALANCKCDGCGELIFQGAECAAVSVSTPSLPYTAWEHDFIDVPRPRIQSTYPPLPR